MIKPLGDRIVVKPIQIEETTKGGIILPGASKEKSQEGIVAAIGSGRVLESGERMPLEVSVGDKVLFSKFAGTEISQGDELVVIMYESDVLAIL